MFELSKQLGVDKSKSSRLHPQGDGMSESFVKQLKACVQKQVEKNGTDWDLYLQATAFAIRTNQAYNTKLSPAELIVGSKLMLPIDDVVVENAPKTKNKQSHEYAKELKNKIHDSNKLVQDNLLQSRNKMKQQFDKNTKIHKFVVGQPVMLWKPYKKNKLSRCFQPNWNRPWLIEHFTNDLKSNCKIRCCMTGNTLNVHVSQLKPVRMQDAPKPPAKTIIEKDIPMVVQDHYLDDFMFVEEEDEGVRNVVINNQNAQGVGEVPGPVEGPVIDNAWVDVDPANVIPRRTRGVRIDYALLDGGEVV